MSTTGLRDIGTSLPPGFRFHPSDQELVCHYLRNKIENHHVSTRGTLVEIDLHVCEPWQLPEVAKMNSNEWYFFSFRDRKYATGFRTNRATSTGYWKATGKDRVIRDPKGRRVVGMRKTLVFYRHRAPNGIKTGWIMHEFRLQDPNTPPKEDWVLCRVFHKGKSENNHNGSSPSSSHHTEAATHQSLFCSASTSQCQLDDQNQNITFSNTLLNLPSIPGEDYLKLPNEIVETPSNNMMTMLNSHECVDDDFGFLLDMNFQEHTTTTTNYENITFQEDTNSFLFR